MIIIKKRNNKIEVAKQHEKFTLKAKNMSRIIIYIKKNKTNNHHLSFK